MNSESFIKLLSGHAEDLAPRLLGSELVRTINGQTITVKIVETEAYNQTDVASHSYNGQTERTKVMFGPAGHLYVYFTYGMHYCCNIVVGAEGEGAAVLIRAVEPIIGVESLRQNRPHGASDYNLTNGPAKLCQAMRIDKSLNGHGLYSEPLQLILKPPVPLTEVTQTTRIGITKGKDVPWRFYISNSQYVSKQG